MLHMLSQAQLARILLPIGELTKTEVRQIAADLGLRTAAKPDSQDVCFITRSGGRQAFLGSRIPLRRARVVDTSGALIGEVPAVELVTLGQRKGLGELGPGATPEPSGSSQTEIPTVVTAPEAGSELGPELAFRGRRYVVDVDVPGATVTVGPLEALLVNEIAVRDAGWVDAPPADGEALEVQFSAHGRPVPASWSADGIVVTAEPIRRVAPGQSVVLYRGDAVVGGGTATWSGEGDRARRTPWVSSTV